MSSTNTPLLEAPDFCLPDQDGRRFHLREQRDFGVVVVVFIRGHWCPYCRRYLGKLQANFPRFREFASQLIAISPEPQATSRQLAEELKLSFPLLRDASGEIIDRYGTRNGHAGRGTLLPHPSVFVIDAGGTIRFRSIDRNYQKRTTMRTIFSVLASLRDAGTD